MTLGYLRPQKRGGWSEGQGSQWFPGLHRQVIYGTHQMFPFRKQDKTFSWHINDTITCFMLHIFGSGHLAVEYPPSRVGGNPLKIEGREGNWLGEGSLIFFYLSEILSPLWTR